MKKLISLTLITILSLTTLTACSSGSETSNTDTEVNTDDVLEVTVEEEEEETYNVGMSTDSGTIDDKSFNQGTWEGIVRYEEENEGVITSKYIKPNGEAKSDYIESFDNLVDAGYQMIVAPGFKFEEAINEAQINYPEVNFVILDGYPHETDDYTPNIADNTLAISFAEEESGFYAGVTAALNSKTGKVGFIGGMEIPAVQKFGWGYVAGVAYANKNEGTNVEVSQYIYQGTFTDVAAGKTLAASYYDQDIDIIFAAAGGVGIGVIDEGKTRRTSGEDVWVIGVDTDQYADGMYTDTESVILTSATKNLQQATYDAIDDAVNGTFEGGNAVVLDTSVDGVGLPPKNPNLDENSLAKYNEVYELVKDGTIIVPDNKEDLDSYLTELEYVTPGTIGSY